MICEDNILKFSRNETLIVKGIAILAMLWHHTCPNDPGLTYFLNVQLYGKIYVYVVIAEMCKICVPLLSMLSGIGMTYSYEAKERKKSLLSDYKFVVSHLVQLYSLWWSAMVFIWILKKFENISLSNMYGVGLGGLINILLDVFGVARLFKTPTVIATGWYMSAIIIFYLLFPILYRACKKIRLAIVVISYIPWIVYLYKNDISMHTDWWLFYVYAFVIGILLVQFNVLNYLMTNRKWYNCLFSLVLLVIAIGVRLFGALPFDGILSLAVLFATIQIFIRNDTVIARGLRFLGMYSALIWLLHSYIGGMLSGVQFSNYFYQFVSVTFFSLAICVMLDLILNVIGYKKIILKLREKIQ